MGKIIARQRNVQGSTTCPDPSLHHKNIISPCHILQGQSRVNICTHCEIVMLNHEGQMLIKHATILKRVVQNGSDGDGLAKDSVTTSGRLSRLQKLQKVPQVSQIRGRLCCDGRDVICSFCNFCKQINSLPFLLRKNANKTL